MADPIESGPPYHTPSQPDEVEAIAWPDPTPEMLVDPLFDAIWAAIKTWDVNVPSAYRGYCGATGNHARAIMDSILAMQAERRGHDPLGDLVQRFADALLAKLRLAQANGRSGWDQDDWEEACRKGLMRHIEKGDPRDVAAYCAFMWHHGWSTAPPKPDPIAPLTEGSFVKGGHNSFPSQIKDRPAAPAPINKPPAQPAPIAGLEPVAWRPIKTAPRNGTSILCFTPDNQSDFSDESGIDVLWFDGGAWLYNAEPVMFQPTHWMPLPASPNAASSGYYTRPQLEAHAAEQVRAEREACAVICEEWAKKWGVYSDLKQAACENDADAIRARGQV